MLKLLRPRRSRAWFGLSLFFFQPLSFALLFNLIVYLSRNLRFRGGEESSEGDARDARKLGSKGGCSGRNLSP